MAVVTAKSRWRTWCRGMKTMARPSPRTTSSCRGVGRGTEDVHGHLVGEAGLIGAWAAPQGFQLVHRQARLFAKFSVSSPFGRLSRLDMAARQAPLVRRDGRAIIAVLHEYRSRGISKQHER